MWKRFNKNLRPKIWARTHTPLHVFSLLLWLTRCVQRGKGVRLQREKVDTAETLQWPRAFFSDISVGLNLGSNVYTTVFCVSILRGIGALTNSAISSWKDTFNLRLETLKLCSIHARSRTRQYTQTGRRYDSNKPSLKYYIYGITRNLSL